MRVGFIGLGQMGRPIALNLRRSGATVLAADTRAASLAGLEEAGLVATTDFARLGDVDVLFLCLPDGDVVESVLLGEEGLARLLPAGRTIVDLSTVAYKQAVAIGRSLEARALRFLDAPVSGAPARAIDGTLTVMCGGDPATFAQVRPLLDCIGTTILHMGASGSGQLTKTINNILYDINIAALAEVLPMAVRMGLDPALIGSVVTTGTGRSFAADYFVPRILAGRFDEGYPMALAYKDLVSGAGVSAEHGIPMPVLAAATATYQTALRKGHGARDKGAMILPFEEMLGVAFRAAAEAEEGEA
ncbi:NAD(P)-dependent oxidoreductase [Methylobacterium trifolii]|uniref:2-(Hydroxymethyl)glutarate dehydrogenase n=1 Tax=Methylobacterium trifolii TaxID=1003092 RepID=A0ABQ4TT89_9HYPH|nr:NAD(P)-dependent oxidoreductase [Methylobacterium trifolii]GJE58529.1 2-(hydroxymethyl)glutarate dehydrogenase [Methylobacterium trifolii]